MKTEASSDHRDGEENQPTGRFTLALFVVAELLCTGVIIVWLL